jgi:hypothetical protein
MKKFAKFTLLAAAGLLLGLLAVEVALRVMKYPRFYKAHSSPPQFAFVDMSRTNAIYVNTPSTRIRFVYDGNPRGYFGADNEVDHLVNSAGFRGPEFVLMKPSNTLRIACLGDSFTFGEGVRFEDTYAERAASLLRAHLAGHAATAESFNFGVGGFNTEQELSALRNFALRVDPDVVVVGYTLNDPEPFLFQIDPWSGRPVRRPRELAIPEGLSDALPPTDTLYGSRIAQLCWQRQARQELTRKTVGYYQQLFLPDSDGWQRSRLALRAIIGTCQVRRIPCIVLLFPVLYRLDDSYPFLAAHQLVKQEVASANGICVDLFPLLKGRSGPALWVHPTDPHPNEVVHAIAAEALSAQIARTPRYRELLQAPAGEGAPK